MMRQGMGLVAVAMLAAVLGGAGLSASEPEKAPEVFRATTANMTPAGLGLKVDVLRWSSDEQRAAAIAALEADAEESLEDLPTMGYVWPDDSGLGYSVKYAHRVETADGGERITLVTGRPLGTFSREAWTADDVPARSAHDFTVIELRLDKDGQGAGTMSLAAGVAVDEGARTVALEGYEAAPALLTAVTREPEPYWARRE